jgi:D-serine deaminase-like pyridoxal phosphate-dependent protein
VVQFVQKYPGVKLAVTGDHPGPIRQLGDALASTGKKVEVLLDIDSGQHRTGVPAGPAAEDLYRLIVSTRGLIAGGFHLYDGHNHQTDLAERREAVLAGWSRVAALRDDLVSAGLPAPTIVAGGSGSFPIFAALDDPAIELSPGTVIFNDWGYSTTFPDLKFTPAALLITRVISRPTSERVTLDLGYKAVASDPPAGNRLLFPDLPDAKAVLQNEEHLVLQTAEAERFQPGDELLAIPRHICPTCALHKEVYVVSGGRVIGTWQVAARDRMLTV